MACSCVGLVAIISAALALIFSWLAFGLPLWSANSSAADKSGNNLSGSAEFGVGVYGICNDVAFEAQDGNAALDANNCYLYYSNDRISTLSKQPGAPNLAMVEFDTSLCKLYEETEKVPIGVPVTVKFLRDTCGSLGKATLSMAVLAPIFGTFVVVFLLLGITCCKKNSLFVRLGAYLAVFATIFQIIAFSLWIQQSKDLHDQDDGTKFNVSFAFAVVSAFLYAVATASSFAHADKGKEEELAREQNGYTNASPASGAPIVENSKVGV